MMLCTSYKSCRVLPTTLLALAIRLTADALTFRPENTLLRVLSWLRSNFTLDDVTTDTKLSSTALDPEALSPVPVIEMAAAPVIIRFAICVAAS